MIFNMCLHIESVQQMAIGVNLLPQFYHYIFLIMESNFYIPFHKKYNSPPFFYLVTIGFMLTCLLVCFPNEFKIVLIFSHPDPAIK